VATTNSKIPTVGIGLSKGIKLKSATLSAKRYSIQAPNSTNSVPAAESTIFLYYPYEIFLRFHEVVKKRTSDLKERDFFLGSQDDRLPKPFVKPTASRPSLTDQLTQAT